MPAMITHCYLAQRAMAAFPDIVDKDAFMLGAQGPDLFFFFRAYPWLPGQKGMPYGNALHDTRPSRLFDEMMSVARQAPSTHQDILQSYITGFLCHYAADRTIHPFVCSRQRDLAAQFPSFAAEDNPYHYRYESAIDTIVLQTQYHASLSHFPLRTVVPKPSPTRDRVLAQFYHRVLLQLLDVDIPESTLLHLNGDMRHSMRWMTDRFGLKRRAFRFIEIVTRKGAWYSALIRTPHIDEYDYPNDHHTEWTWEAVTRTKTLFEMFEETVTVSVDLIDAFYHGADGMTLTGDIDFSGRDYSKTNREDAV